MERPSRKWEFVSRVEVRGSSFHILPDEWMVYGSERFVQGVKCLKGLLASFPHSSRCMKNGSQLVCLYKGDWKPLEQCVIAGEDACCLTGLQGRVAEAKPCLKWKHA